MITNPNSGTNIHEITDGIYRINTPIRLPDGAPFSFNQYLVVDDEPLLFHTGPRKLFPLVSEAIGRVLPLDRLRYVGLSHVEADECGSMNEFLAVAPRAVPLCGQIAAMVSMNDLADRAPRALADGERTHAWPPRDALVRYAPHAARLGMRADDGRVHQHLFLWRSVHAAGRRRGGADGSRHSGPQRSIPAADGLLRARAQTTATLNRLADEKPKTLACMHGSAWRGDGGSLLRDLARALTAAA